MSHLNYFFTIKSWKMKHSYLRAAMLDIGEWIREWNPGEDVVILLWCRGLQWRGDVVPTAQLHKNRRKVRSFYWCYWQKLSFCSNFSSFFYCMQSILSLFNQKGPESLNLQPPWLFLCQNMFGKINNIYHKPWASSRTKPLCPTATRRVQVGHVTKVRGQKSWRHQT